MVTSPFFFLYFISRIWISLGILSCVYIAFDERHRPTPHMAIMKWVWPMNALWAGPFGIWAYRELGHGKKTVSSSAGSMAMPESMDPMSGRSSTLSPSAEQGKRSMEHSAMFHRPFWQSVTVGTLHCGAGCTLADLVGPWLFRILPFMVLGSMLIGEWTLDYALALLFGVFFQYAGLAAMTSRRGAGLWWQALKVDFFSLTAWQIGMYGWMAIAMFGLSLPMAPNESIFWFMMQISMFCGFLTSYPMNWFLIRTGVKSAM